MQHYEHFGDVLREIRESKKISREQLANNICTSKQIYRIEKGESEPSLYLLNQLSIKLNVDLNGFYKFYFSNSIIGMEGYNDINSAIESGDILLLKQLVQKYDTINDFKQGRNLQIIYYAKALCSALLENNYSTSLDYCYKGILLECPSFNVEKLSEHIYSNIGITLIVCMSQNYFSTDQFNVGMKILLDVSSVIESHFLNPTFPIYYASQFAKKVYQAILHNICFYLLDSGDIKTSMIYVEKGINFSIKENNIRHLSELIFVKFKILYQDKKYEEALEYYSRTLCLYKITNKNDKSAELEALAKTDYKEIFT